MTFFIGTPSYIRHSIFHTALSWSTTGRIGPTSGMMPSAAKGLAHVMEHQVQQNPFAANHTSVYTSDTNIPASDLDAIQTLVYDPLHHQGSKVACSRMFNIISLEDDEEGVDGATTAEPTITHSTSTAMSATRQRKRIDARNAKLTNLRRQWQLKLDAHIAYLNTQVAYRCTEEALLVLPFGYANLVYTKRMTTTVDQLFFIISWLSCGEQGGAHGKIFPDVAAEIMPAFGTKAGVNKWPLLSYSLGDGECPLFARIDCFDRFKLRSYSSKPISELKAQLMTLLSSAQTHKVPRETLDDLLNSTVESRKGRKRKLSTMSAKDSGSIQGTSLGADLSMSKATNHSQELQSGHCSSTRVVKVRPLRIQRRGQDSRHRNMPLTSFSCSLTTAMNVDNNNDDDEDHEDELPEVPALSSTVPALSLSSVPLICSTNETGAVSVGKRKRQKVT